MFLVSTHLNIKIYTFYIFQVRFIWLAGKRKYKYNFYRLESHDHHLLLDPTVDIAARGRIPRQPGAFSVQLPCTANLSGIAAFSIGLEITAGRRRLAGTPLQLRLRKECRAGGEGGCGPGRAPLGIKVEREQVVNNDWCGHGECDPRGGCICRPGWAGQTCNSPVCSPQCMNGGTCSAPSVCDCPAGFQGRSCEGGICRSPCLNRGKCVQKDTCSCKSGFYGSRCEFSKCVVPCVNGGQCRGVNRCRCPAGYSGEHCQVSQLLELHGLGWSLGNNDRVVGAGGGGGGEGGPDQRALHTQPLQEYQEMSEKTLRTDR